MTKGRQECVRITDKDDDYKDASLFQMPSKHGWCVRITDAGVITIANTCSTLKFLRY